MAGTKVGNKGFRSSDFIFRNTVVGDALNRAGISTASHQTREAKFFGLLRARDDRYNSRPSVSVHIRPEGVPARSAIKPSLEIEHA